MDLKDVYEKLDFLEFRQELLFEDTEFNRLLFEYRVTRKQTTQIYDLMDKYREMISDNEDVYHGTFEQEIYSIVPDHDGNYHFAEFIAQDLHKAGRWEEVFEKLYGDMLKFQSYLKKSE